MCDSRQPEDGAGSEPALPEQPVSVWRQALQTALATVCRCAPVNEYDRTHRADCPIWQYGFTGARELLGIER